MLGPLPESNNNTNYIVTVLDDFTGLVQSSNVRYKSQASPWIAETQIETQTGRKVRFVRSDNGKEYITRRLDAFLKERGALHHFTAPYTPVQNGRAERFNRTSTEKMRTIIAACHIPVAFWDYVSDAATLLYNVTLSSGRTETPYKLFWGRDFDYSRLKVFGSRAYALIPKEKTGSKSKLEPRSERGRLIGFSLESEAWLVPLDDMETVRLSRNVRFLESDACFDVDDPEQLRLLHEPDGMDSGFDDEGLDALASPPETQPAAHTCAPAPAPRMPAPLNPLESNTPQPAPLIAPRARACSERIPNPDNEVPTPDSVVKVTRTGRVSAPFRKAGYIYAAVSSQSADEPTLQEAQSGPARQDWHAAI